jgi:SAM-dependent methyltransferase
MGQTSFDPSEYGRHIAASYDQTTGALDPTAELTLLTELAAGGPVLEFGIGTGRLALPLAAQGLTVAGIDGSPEMVEQLRRKPGGEHIEVAIGDFSHTRIPGQFALVIIAMNTIFALPSQDAQVACFRNAAAHLGPGGRFVVDCWIPDIGAFRRDRGIRIVEIAAGRVVLEVGEIHPATQTMRTNKVFLESGSVQVHPANHRFAWPAEMDLMARLAGLGLEHRWADHRKTPFTDASEGHVSVWRAAG